MAHANPPEVPSRKSVKRKTELSQHTHSTMVEVNFTWKIDNFSFIARTMKNGERLESKLFSADGDEKVNWKLHCYPIGGNEKDAKDMFSYFLHYDSGPIPMAVEFILGISDTTGSVLIHRVVNHTFTRFVAHGFANFVSQKDLLEKYVKKDTLTLQCKLSYTVQNVDCSNPSSDKVPRQELSEECITHHLGNLLNTGRMADITFTVGIEKFKAHKNILISRSPAFADMLEINGKISPIKNLKIEDCEPAVFEVLLRFLYTDQMEETEEMAMKLMPIAKRYQVKLLLQKCEDVLLKNISTENCADILMMANTHDALLLKKDASDYFRLHSGEVIKTAGWQTLRQTQPQLGFEVCEITAASI